MSNDLVVKQNQIQEIIPLSKKELLRDMICKGASDNELTLFIENCNRTGLDPFQKQCWAVKRWDKSLGREVMAFQTGVDGFRVIANRSNKYAGQVGPMWCGEDGKWTDVWLKDKPPIAAKVGILRTDFKEPLWAVARFSSYAAKTKEDKLTQFWHKMPDLMIAKVAECLALRKTFPQDLSGVYSQEEMEQAEVIKDVSPRGVDVNKISKVISKEELSNLKPNIEKETSHIVYNKAPQNDAPISITEGKRINELIETKKILTSDIKSTVEQLFGLQDHKQMKIWQAEIIIGLLVKSTDRDSFGKNVMEHQEGARK